MILPNVRNKTKYIRILILKKTDLIFILKFISNLLTSFYLYIGHRQNASILSTSYTILTSNFYKNYLNSHDRNYASAVRFTHI